MVFSGDLLVHLFKGFLKPGPVAGGFYSCLSFGVRGFSVGRLVACFLHVQTFVTSVLLALDVWPVFYESSEARMIFPLVAPCFILFIFVRRFCKFLCSRLRGAIHKDGCPGFRHCVCMWHTSFGLSMFRCSGF